MDDVPDGVDSTLGNPDAKRRRLDLALVTAQDSIPPTNAQGGVKQCCAGALVDCHGQGRRFYDMGRMRYYRALVDQKTRPVGSVPMASAPSAAPDLSTFPDELWANIFGRLPCLMRMVTVGLVSHHWRSIALDTRSAGSLCVKEGTARWSACAHAASQGHTECFLYAVALGCSWKHTDVLGDAAKGGHIGTFVAAHRLGCGEYSDTITKAAHGGYLAICKYALDVGINVHWPNIIDAAWRNGHAHILEWATERGHTYSAPKGSGQEALQVSSHLVSPHCILESRCQGDATRVCVMAASRGHLDCLAYFHGKGCAWDERTCQVAVRWGNMDCFEFALTRGCPWDAGSVKAAARHGNVEALARLLAGGCPHDARACKAAAVTGNLECLRLLHEHGCPWDARTCTAASYRGHIECLKYAHEHGCPWDERACVPRDGTAYIECLWYAYENECRPSGGLTIATIIRAFGSSEDDLDRAWTAYGIAPAPRDIKIAIVSGSNGILRYVRKYLNFPLTASACAKAAKHGSVYCLDYLRQEGCPCDPVDCANSAAAHGHLNVLEYLYVHYGVAAWSDRTLYSATWVRNWDCARFLCENQCPWPRIRVDQSHLADMDYWLTYAFAPERVFMPIDPDDKTPEDAVRTRMNIAARRGKVALLRALEHHTRPEWWTPQLYKSAISESHWDTVIYLYERGCAWHVTTSRAAARNADVRFLAFVHTRGCPWDASVCATATIECLQYAHEHGCPWDYRTCFKAVRYQKMSRLDYAHRHGCPWNLRVWRKAQHNANKAMARYMLDHGFVPPPSSADAI